MSRKLLVLCFLLAWGGLGSVAVAQGNDDPAEKADDKAGASKANNDNLRQRRPLDRAKEVLNRNAQAQPQSQGLDNANERVIENQERFIEKHPDGASVSDRLDRGGPERPDVARPDIPRGPRGVDRPDRSARKGR
jgi:hypothetical protein